MNKDKRLSLLVTDSDESKVKDLRHYKHGN